MKPFAIFKNGKFTKLQVKKGQARSRFRIDLWVKMDNNEKIEHQITTKETVWFQDLMEHTVQPAIDTLLNEVDHEITSFGFNCYFWG